MSKQLSAEGVSFGKEGSVVRLWMVVVLLAMMVDFNLENFNGACADKIDNDGDGDIDCDDDKCITCDACGGDGSECKKLCAYNEICKDSEYPPAACYKAANALECTLKSD